MQKIILFFSACFLSTFCAAQYGVTPANQPPFDPEKMVTQFLTESGINVLKVEFFGQSSAAGFFNDGDDAIGIRRGLLLTTGAAASNGTLSFGADGAGVDFANNDNLLTNNDPLFESLTTGPVRDLTKYKITFQAYNDSIRFRYVFASEEYPEFACSSYNDVFGFFLQGPGYPTPVNIARIPGTGLPVTINTIHPANPNYPDCPPKNLQYYHDNSQNPTPPTYDGYLDVFTAEAVVVPCETYTMTLGVADAGDGLYDSAVFLEANSFGSRTSVTSGLDSSDLIIPEPATANPIKFYFKDIAPILLPVTIKLAGEAQNGVDYALVDSVYTITTKDSTLEIFIQPLADTLLEPAENLRFEIQSAGCFSKQYELLIVDPDSLFTPVDSFVLTPMGLVIGDVAFESFKKGFSFASDEVLPIPSNASPLNSKMEVKGIGDKFILNNINILESVCFDIDHPWVDDLDIYLVAPDGKFLELTTDNGGNGDNYTNTCFSPSATNSITGGGPFAPASMAPFTGVFQPEAPWTDLLGSPLDGEWKLNVRDDATGFSGTLKRWSLTFSGAGLGDFKYRWSTGDSTRTIAVDQPGLYSLTVSNGISALVKQYRVNENCGYSLITPAVCPGETFTLNGVTFSENHPQGFVYFPATPLCDSIVEVKLQILPAHHVEIDQYACQGDSVYLGGVLVIVPAAIQMVFVSFQGCDSTVTHNFNALPVYSDTLYESLAPGDTLIFGGQTITQAGFYSMNLQTVNGCDSTLAVVVTVSGTEDKNSLFLSAAPNPTNGNCTLDLTALFGRALTLEVFDVLGKPVYREKFMVAPARKPLDMSDWKSGVYWIKVTDAGGKSGVFRMVRS